MFINVPFLDLLTSPVYITKTINVALKPIKIKMTFPPASIPQGPHQIRLSVRSSV